MGHFSLFVHGRGQLSQRSRDIWLCLLVPFFGSHHIGFHLVVSLVIASLTSCSFFFVIQAFAHFTPGALCTFTPGLLPLRLWLVARTFILVHVGWGQTVCPFFAVNLGQNMLTEAEGLALSSKRGMEMRNLKQTPAPPQLSPPLREEAQLPRI